MASSTLALDFLRRLLCAHAAGGGNAGSSNAECGGGDGALVMQQLPAASPARSPCVVARLMGLDAMPPSPPPPETETEGCQPPLLLRRRRRRSRSVSSVDGWPPAYVREESDEFLVLSFSPEANNGGRRRDDEIVGAKKQSNGRPRRKLQYGGDGDGRRSPASVLDTQHSSSSETTATTMTTVSSSSEEVEPSSPPSPTSEEIRPAPNQQNSRRKLQTDFDNDLDNPSSPATSTCHVSKCSDRERRNRSVVKKAEVFTPNVSCTLQYICRLVEEDLNSMRWLTRDFEEDIAADIGSEILDQLISETTDGLIQITSSETVYSLPDCFISMRYPCSKMIRNMQATRG
uniref:DUF3741 domain-containing protein n=1 Tax=Leersia perrieri TaxID=77586 RepID=A0A0D9WCB1_9ORYZ